MVPLGIKLFSKGDKTIFANCLPYVCHQPHIIVQVMDRIEIGGQNFLGHKKMAQIGPGVVAAGITGTGRIRRGRILLISGVSYNNPAR